MRICAHQEREGKQSVSQSKKMFFVVLFILDLLFAQQKIANNRMFEGWNREQGTTACTNPVHNNVFNVRVTWTSPFEASAQNWIKISTRIIEGFKIEKWGENNHQPGDVMVPEFYQTGTFFTGNDKWGSNEAVKYCRIFWWLFTESFWGQTAEKRCNAFNHCTSQWGNLKEVRVKV